MFRNSGSQAALSGLPVPEMPAAPQNDFDTGALLSELPVQPAFSALASDAGTETAVLRESTGSGSVPVKIAAAVYAFNLSFNNQALALDLLV